MPTKHQLIEAELLACRDRKGKITPRAVVARARRYPRGLLYKQFGKLWSARYAQEIALQDRARELMTLYLTITVVHKNTRYVVPRYIRDPETPPQHQGSADMTTFSQDNAEKAIETELERCTGIIMRARGVAAVLDRKYPGLADKFDDALDALACVHRALGRKAA